MKKFLIFVGLVALSVGAQADTMGQSSSDAGAMAILDASQGPVTSNYEAADLSERNPDAIAPSYPTSHKCALGIGGAGSGWGFGISIGGHYTDEDCVLRLDSEHAGRMGDKPTARELMCTKFSFYAANRRGHSVGTALACAVNQKYDDKLAGNRIPDSILLEDEEQVSQVNPTRVEDDGFAWQNSMD